MFDCAEPGVWFFIIPLLALGQIFVLVMGAL